MFNGHDSSLGNTQSYGKQLSIRSSCSTSWSLEEQYLLAQILNMHSRDGLHASRGYNTCISDNNKSGRGERSLKTKIIKRL